MSPHFDSKKRDQSPRLMCLGKCTGGSKVGIVSCWQLTGLGDGATGLMGHFVPQSDSWDNFSRITRWGFWVRQYCSGTLIDWCGSQLVLGRYYVKHPDYLGFALSSCSEISQKVAISLSPVPHCGINRSGNGSSKECSQSAVSERECWSGLCHSLNPRSRTRE